MAKKKALKIPSDVVKKALYLDCTKDENIRKLKKLLMKLPFIKDEGRINDIEYLENIWARLEKKYEIKVGYITMKEIEDKRIYSFMIKGTVDGKKHQWLEDIDAITMWEGIAKTIFFMYYFISLPDDKKEAKGGF